MVPIHWAESPPATRSRVYAELVTPQTRQGFHGIALAPTISGVFTHFVDGRTRPCAGADCWCVREGRQPRWKGYLPILMFPAKKTVLFELTEGAAAQLLAGQVELNSLRGVHFHTYRRTNKTRSPVDVVREPSTYPHFLPEPFDPVPVLLNLWGVKVRFTDGLPFAGGTQQCK